MLSFCTRGYAVSDLLTEISKLVTALSLPSDVTVHLVQRFADIECVDGCGGDSGLPSTVLLSPSLTLRAASLTKLTPLYHHKHSAPSFLHLHPPRLYSRRVC